MQCKLSNLYPIDGPAFLLTQVCLVCAWILNKGQITVLIFCTVGATIDCDLIMLFLYLPLEFSPVGGINGSERRSLSKVAHKGSAFSAYICLKYKTIWISEQKFCG